MRVNRRVDMRLERQPAHHQLLADDHLAIDPFADPLRRNVLPRSIDRSVCHCSVSGDSVSRHVMG